MSAGTHTYTQAKTGEKVTVPLHSELLAHLETLAGTDQAGSVHHANTWPD